MEPSLGECQSVLRMALSADESGEGSGIGALELYTKFVEMSLQVKNPANKQKIQPLANQAMDRAEVLKRTLMPPSQSSPQDEVSLGLPSVQPEDDSPLTLSSGNSNYTPEEIRVLEHGSRINKLIVVPFMNIDLRERFIFPLPFSDPDGLLALAPKQRADFVQWLRIDEISDDPKVTVNGTIDYFSIKQTVVSDCSFVASLAVSALYEKRFGKNLITAILYPKNAAGRPIYNPSGKYFVKLHINGVPRKVVVDERLPTGKHRQLLCSHSSNRHEFWVSILEKAYMKVMGGYDFPGSNSNIDLHALTGWIPERISIHSQQSTTDANAVFDRLRNGLSMGRCLITAATGELSDADEKRTGLVPTHAYAVLDMREINGVQLVQMKNPWSHLRWRGNYSELDVSHWTEELKATLNYDPAMAEQVDNGIFWIDYRSVMNFFDVFYINWDPALFQHTYCVHQMWNAGVGPTKDAYTISENPQYSLNVGPGNGSVWVLLTRHITTIDDFRNNREYIAIVAYESGKKVYYPYEPKPFHEGTRINSPHYLCKIRQDPSRQRSITLVISQYEKSTTIYFTLRAYSRERFELRRIDSGFVKKEELSGAWKGITAGGCPNNVATYGNNPKFKLTVGTTPKHRPSISVELRAPKVFQVGFEISQLTGTEKFATVSSGSYRSGYVALEIEHIPPGTYLIIPATFLPGQESPFFLNVKAQNGIKLEEVTRDFEFRP